MLCFLVLMTQGSFSQIDSLKNLLKPNLPDTEKIKVYEELSFYHIRLNMKAAESYRDSAALLAKKVNINKFTAYAEIAEASILSSKSLFRKAIQHYFKSNNLLDKSEPILQGANYSDAAYCYYSLGIKDSFFFYSIKAIKLFEKNKREDKMIRTYGNMAYIHTTLGKFEEAKKYFKISNDLAHKLNDKRSLSKNLQNQGVMYEYMSMPDSALYFYQEALKLKQEIGDSLGLATSYSGIATVFLLKKQFPQFLKNINLSIAIAQKMKNIGYEANGYFYKGEAYYTIEKIDSCIYYMNKSLKLNKETGDISRESDCYMYISDCYDIKKDYKQALEYHKLYKTYYDSLFKQESVEQLENLKIGFETEKKEEENKLLQTENKLSTATIKQQKIVTYFIIGGLLIVSLLAYFIFRGLKTQRKANAIISKQKEEVDKQKGIIEEHQKETIDSINYAKKIQYALLANDDLLKNNLPNHFVLFNPKDIVSGDFYWATEHNNKFYLAICDSTGHGVPGAFMSLLNMGFLSEAIKEKNIEEPHEIFNYVRLRLINSISSEQQKDGMDGILLCIDRTTNQITYSAANNEPILISNNQVIELPKNKMPVGKGEKTESFTLHQVNASKGDVLYLYTDGYADQFGGPKGKKFKYKQLNDLLLNSCHEDLNKQKEILLSTFTNWKGNLEQVDDVLIIGIKV